MARCESEIGDALPIGVPSPHLPRPVAEQSIPGSRVGEPGTNAAPPASSAVVNEPFKRRARRRGKQLLMRVPAIERYISEKHVIAAERDQAVKDREVYVGRLEKAREAATSLQEANRKLRSELDQAAKDREVFVELLAKERAKAVSLRERHQILVRERQRYLDGFGANPEFRHFNASFLFLTFLRALTTMAEFS